jgi:hypothetical protein
MFRPLFLIAGRSTPDFRRELTRSVIDRWVAGRYLGAMVSILQTLVLEKEKNDVPNPCGAVR